jgi:hypothetical protein
MFGTFSAGYRRAVRGTGLDPEINRDGVYQFYLVAAQQQFQLFPDLAESGRLYLHD